MKVNLLTGIHFNGTRIKKNNNTLEQEKQTHSLIKFRKEIFEPKDTQKINFMSTYDKAGDLFYKSEKTANANDLAAKIPAKQAENNNSLKNEANIRGFRRIAGYKNELNTLSRIYNQDKKRAARR